MKDNVWSFHYHYRNVNPFMESFRDKKFTTRHKRHNPIPHSWLSSCGKIEIPHSQLRHSWGISISPRLLSHSWGIGISLLWLVVNFQFLNLQLRSLCRNYPIPETFHKLIGWFSSLYSDCRFDCNKVGTKNGVCDQKDGYCKCREGFHGEMCEQGKNSLMSLIHQCNSLILKPH